MFHKLLFEVFGTQRTALEDFIKAISWFDMSKYNSLVVFEGVASGKGIVASGGDQNVLSTSKSPLARVTFCLGFDNGDLRTRNGMVKLSEQAARRCMLYREVQTNGRRCHRNKPMLLA